MRVCEVTQVSLLVLGDSYEFVGKTGNSAHGDAKKQFGKKENERERQRDRSEGERE